MVRAFPWKPWPDNAPVAPDNASVAPDNASVAPDNASVAPDNVPAAPDNVPAAPDNIPAAPDNVPVGPDTWPVAPDNAPVAPDSLPAQPAAAELISSTLAGGWSLLASAISLVPLRMRLLFTKENMFTAAGFVADSFQADLADFVGVAPDEFDAAFVAQLLAARTKIGTATGGALRTGGGAQVTTRLYQNMEALKPLLDRLDIRLGFIPKADLTVAPGKFGLKTLRERIDHRDAEAVSRALVVLRQAVADNEKVLAAKGYPEAEEKELVRLHGLIDQDNATQDTTFNANTKATGLEDADYEALSTLLGKVMRTGRLLYKATKQRRRQYEAKAVTQRVHAANDGTAAAGEQPAK